jgi:hypothetical protein
MSLANPRFIEIPLERVQEEIRKLEGATYSDTGGVEVHSGKHPEHGNIHIIIPPIGDSLLLLPFVIQQF